MTYLASKNMATLTKVPGNYQTPAGCHTCQWLRGKETQPGYDGARKMAVEKLEVPERVNASY